MIDNLQEKMTNDNVETDNNCEAYYHFKLVTAQNEQKEAYGNKSKLTGKGANRTCDFEHVGITDYCQVFHTTGVNLPTAKLA